MIKFEVFPVSPQRAEQIKKISGLDVLGYTHIVDSYAVRHSLLKHGNAEKESRRGQLPLTLDIFEKIPMVLTYPDNISDGGTLKNGRRVIRYEKKLNEKIIYLEEVRTKQKELAMTTIYVKKAR